MSGVDITRDGALVRIAMNRPEKKNALTHVMYFAMAEAIEAAGEDGSVGAILFEGEGGNFTAGNDLSDFLETPPTDETAPAFRFILALAQTDVPLVAAVDGVAVGVGATMLLHCDYVVCERAAMLRMPFIDLGLVPEAASSLLLPRMIGHARAAELLMAGEPIDGLRAHELGIVNEVCAPGVLKAAALQRARSFAAKPVDAMRATKALMKPDRDQIIEHMNDEFAEFSLRLQSQDCRRAISRFLDK